MTLPSFPPQIHYEPEQNTLEFDPNTGVSRTQMDQGPILSRNRFTNIPVIQTFNWYFVPLEFELFKSFFKYTLENGTKWFTLMVWTGSSYASASVQFIEDYKASATGSEDTRVSAKIQIRNLQTLDPGAAWLIGEYGADWVIYVSDKLHKIVNVDMPAAFADY